MNKTMLKGILSTIIGGIVFYFMFFSDKNNDIFDCLIWSVMSCMLGYMFVGSLIMSNKEMEDFENEIDKWIKDDEEKTEE
jgi:hypothetical protein